MAVPVSIISFSCVVGYSRGIYNGAQYYSRNGIGQQQFRNDVGGALRGSGASAAAASSGDLGFCFCRLSSTAGGMTLQL